MQLTIKLIEVEGQYKALVLDMAKKGDRIVYIAENQDKNLAWNEAEAWVESLTNGKTEALTWH